MPRASAADVNPRLLRMVQNSLAHQLGAVVLVTERRLCTVVPPAGFCTACRICVGADGRLTLPLPGAEVAAAAERRGPTESVCPAGLAFAAIPAPIGGELPGYLLVGAVQDPRAFEERLFALSREGGQRPRALAQQYFRNLRPDAAWWAEAADELALAAAMLAGLAQGADADSGAAALLEQVDRHVSPAMPWEDAARSLLQVFCQEAGADGAAVVLCEVEAPAAHGRAQVIAHNLSQSFVNDFLSNPLLGCNPDVDGQGVALDRETGFAPPFNHPQVEAEGIAALVATPLPLSIARGVLYLFAFQPNRFQALSPIRTAIMAREAARLYNAGRVSAELRVRRQTTHAIRDLLLVAGADRQTVAARLRSLVTAGLGMPYCGLFIREEQGDRLSDLVVGDAPAAHPHLRRLAEDCFLSGRTIEADDLEERAAFRAGAGKKARPAFRSLLSIPLAVGERRLGVMQVGFRTAGPLPGPIREMVEEIARTAGALLAVANLQAEVEQAYLEIIESLVTAIQEKDPRLRGHANRVAHYASAIAVAMGLPPEQVARVARAALLHDLGLVLLPEDILRDIGLQGHAREVTSGDVGNHAELAYRILSRVEGLRDIAEMVRYHHERVDGGGPRGLRGEAIPLGARILHLAEAFDTLVCLQPVDPDNPLRTAVQHAVDQAGKAYDREMVAALVSALKTPAFRDALGGNQCVIDFDLEQFVRLAREGGEKDGG